LSNAALWPASLPHGFGLFYSNPLEIDGNSNL
jgi:hypothetical protein